MNWAWGDTLDHVWRSPTFPMWLTVAAAGFFAVVVLITLLRAEKSVANGALTVITLLAVGIALASTARRFGSGSGAIEDSRSSLVAAASLPALACVDDLAGEAVLTACEKAVFASPEAAAASLSYAARQISRLTAFGDTAAANRNMTPELEALRRAVERDRYGLMAQVLTVRDRCTQFDCPAFRSLTDPSRVASNIEERTYDGLITRYSAPWNAPPPAAMAPVAAFIPGVPTGKPTNAEFPSAASTPPVSIMSPEPTTASTSRQPGQAAAASAPKPTAPASTTASSAAAAAKKQPAPPKPTRTPPTAPSPGTSIAPGAPAPAASSE
jgi:hypothetical protein